MHFKQWRPYSYGRPGSSDSAIDLTFSSPDLVWNITWSTLDDSYGSDHIPILISINYFRNTHPPPGQTIESPTNFLSFNLNKADWALFSHHVQTAISLLQDTSSSTISYSSFIEIINQSSNISIPVKKFYTRSYPPSPHGGTLHVPMLLKTGRLF